MRLIEDIFVKLDKYLEKVKLLHFHMGAIIALSMLAAHRSLFVTIIIVAMAGALKECYDATAGKIYGHTADIYDFFFTVLGGLVVCATYLLGSHSLTTH